LKYDLIKRLIDFIFGIVCLLVALPVILVVSIIMAIETKKTPIFVQQRGITVTTGKVKIFKLRTMKNGDKLLQMEKQINNIFVKPSLAGFIPPIGSFLRRTGIDEIPQLINVIKGEMSFIGPRPLTISDLELMKKATPEFYSQRANLKSKPGISGLWQVVGERDKGTENLLFLDQLYDKKKGLLLDLRLMFETTILMLSGKNQDAITNSKIKKTHSLDKYFN